MGQNVQKRNDNRDIISQADLCIWPCPMLLMQTTKTTTCYKQANLHNFYEYLHDILAYFHE